MNRQAGTAWSVLITLYLHAGNLCVRFALQQPLPAVALVHYDCCRRTTCAHSTPTLKSHHQPASSVVGRFEAQNQLAATSIHLRWKLFEWLAGTACSHMASQMGLPLSIPQYGQRCCNQNAYMQTPDPPLDQPTARAHHNAMGSRRSLQVQVRFPPSLAQDIAAICSGARGRQTDQASACTRSTWSFCLIHSMSTRQVP